MGERSAGDRPVNRAIVWAGAVAAGLVVLAIVLHVLAGDHQFGLVASGDGWTYLAVFLLVFGDAICALLPGETTLNAASTLAAGGQLTLWLVMLAGALGSVTGDSALYWIARLGRRRLQSRLERATENPKVTAALQFMGSSAPLLLVAGRYVPGLRFAVNASMGLSAFPYRRFLAWSALGGTIWSVYTCGLAYLVGTALSSFPLASIVISGAITTAAIGVIFVVARKRSRAQTPANVTAAR
jgi:membrane-associated protein